MKINGLNNVFETSLKSYVETRWNTVFDMLDSVLKNFDEIRRTHSKCRQKGRNNNC